MIDLILIVAILATLFYYYGIKPMSYWKERGVKQGKIHWVFGNNWGTILKKHSFVDMIHEAYKEVPGVRYSGVYQFTTPTLLIKDPELIKQICVKDFDYFTDHRNFIPEKADPLFGKNLFALKGQNWRDMRAVLSPTFTSSKMKAMYLLMSECGQNCTKFYLNKHKDNLEIEMKDTFTRFTNDIIASTAFGIKTDSLEEPDNEFYVMGKNATNFGGFWRKFKFFGYMAAPKIFEFFKIGFFGKKLSNYFIDLINDAVTIREQKGIVRPDMINLLIEARKGVQHKEEAVLDTGFAVVQEANLGKEIIKNMTNIDIAAHAMIFFFAGFDAVSTVMAFMSYELAINPDVQKKLREEIEETLESCGGKLTYEVLLKMKYMDMVVSETLRKWANAVVSDRVCTKPYTIQPATPDEQPLHLEVGTYLWFPIFGIHRDPKYYPDPDRFDPERFNDENKKNINPYTYFPFGLGPRNCIGSRFALLEIKVVFFHLLTHFEFIPNAKTRIPLQISKQQLNLTAEGGFWMTLKRIKK